MEGYQINVKARLVGIHLYGMEENSIKIKIKASYREEKMDGDQRKTDSSR